MNSWARYLCFTCLREYWPPLFLVTRFQSVLPQNRLWPSMPPGRRPHRFRPFFDRSLVTRENYRPIPPVSPVPGVLWSRVVVPDGERRKSSSSSSSLPQVVLWRSPIVTSETYLISRQKQPCLYRQPATCEFDFPSLTWAKIISLI